MFGRLEDGSWFMRKMRQFTLGFLVFVTSGPTPQVTNVTPATLNTLFQNVKRTLWSPKHHIHSSNWLYQWDGTVCLLLSNV